MPTPAHFTASAKKRIAAFSFDFFAATLLFLCVSAALETQGVDIGTFRNYVICHAAYHLLFLVARGGSTLGKALQNIAVASETGQPLALWQSVVRVAVRYLPLIAVTVAYVEWETVPAILGFAAKLVAGLVWLGELHLLQNSPGRQTIADRAARSVVVNLPPPHTHRAPAGPMYSATDVEFGVPPRRPPGDA
ncbi:RDD family protein [Rubrivivax albus]|uniref:RDD domain-containing protein n=1 Tax=Rubrivivax albus TaxID=2499835 RepID=A0A437JKL1_9BURK|nr:RDD family protein [Rubrivivax albus]RVT47220.1 hypothetical protein ENE75_24370 [Rubrivivax albus]